MKTLVLKSSQMPMAQVNLLKKTTVTQTLVCNISFFFYDLDHIEFILRQRKYAVLISQKLSTILFNESNISHLFLCQLIIIIISLKLWQTNFHLQHLMRGITVIVFMNEYYFKKDLMWS